MKATILAASLGLMALAASASEEFPFACERYVSPAMTEEYRAEVLAGCAAKKARLREPSRPPTRPNEASAPAKPKVALPKDLAAWAQGVKRKVVRALKDPESARFRELYVSAWNEHGVMRPVLCGQVNAKNSYGGYPGFHRFMADEHGTVFEPGSGAFGEQWDDSCGWKLKAIK